MTWLNWLGSAVVMAGIIFFGAGTLGLLRFPDVYTRLHALTKADNLGLGLVTVGLVIQADTLAVAAKLLLIWLLVVASAAINSYLIANAALRKGVTPWEAP